MPGTPVLQVSEESASSGESVPVHEKPIDGGSQLSTVGSCWHVVVAVPKLAQQYCVPSGPSTPSLQSKVESASSGVSPPVHE